MRRAVIVLVIAAITAVPTARVGAARGAKVPAWLQELARHDAAALGDAKPRSISFRFDGWAGTVVMRGRFACSRPRCPFVLNGHIDSVRGTIATIRVNTHSRAVIGYGLTYPRLVLCPGSPSPPARVQIEFSEAAESRAGVFSSLRRSPGPGRPEIAAHARRIVSLCLNGRSRELLVAPTRGGGFCSSLTGPYGGTGCPLTSAARREHGVLAPGMTGDASGPILFNGYFTFADAARLRVDYQDGRRDTIPFAWVSAPIRAGFFLYGLTEHRRPGHRPVTLTLLNAHGKQLAERRLPS
jgi:hypothetical protein